MKTCKDCGETKNLSSFYKHSAMKDGYLNKCKTCVTQRVGKHRGENIEKIREYDRGRGARTTAEQQREYKKRNPKKKYAQATVANALVLGKLKTPSGCSKCHTQGRVVAHHDDYDRALEVRWLCQACHVKWHQINGEGLNAHEKKD